MYSSIIKWCFWLCIHVRLSFCRYKGVSASIISDSVSASEDIELLLCIIHLDDNVPFSHHPVTPDIGYRLVMCNLSRHPCLSRSKILYIQHYPTKRVLGQALLSWACFCWSFFSSTILTMLVPSRLSLDLSCRPIKSWDGQTPVVVWGVLQYQNRTLAILLVKVPSSSPSLESAQYIFQGH